MQLYGILGYPLTHTLSPAMQQAAFDALRLPACYAPFEVAPRDLARAVRLLRRMDAAGFNVTVPHKERIARYLDGADATARALGAVNTVVRRGRRLIGYNTDSTGLLAAWRALRWRVQGKTVLVLGAGGAARAVIWAAQRAGARRIILTNRTQARAERIARWSRRQWPLLHIAVVPWARRAAALSAAPSLIVNATTLGLHPRDPAPLPPASVPRGTRVFDLVYGRPVTRWVAALRRRGCLAHDGRSMLLYQGVEAFKLWTRRRPPVRAMRRALARALHGR